MSALSFNCPANTDIAAVSDSLQGQVEICTRPIDVKATLEH